jgi:hypothetical protein
MRYFATRGGIFIPFYADLFNLRSFELSPVLGLPPSIQSHSPLCIATHDR